MKKILIMVFVLVATASTFAQDTITEQVDSSTYITTEYKTNRRGYVKEMKIVKLETLDQQDLQPMEASDPEPAVAKTQENKEEKRARRNNSTGGRLLAHVAQDLVLVGEATLLGKLFP